MSSAVKTTLSKFMDGISIWSRLIPDLIVSLFLGSLGDLARFFNPQRWRQKNISGKLVVITGGCGGLGFEMASEFLKRRARVVLLDINEKALDETASKLNRQFESEFIVTMKCDVSNYDETCVVAARIVADSEMGVPDYLICGAGVLYCDYLIDASPASIRRTFEINVFGMFWTIKAFLPAMLAANRGHIVIISSMGGLAAAPGSASYCSSKFAVSGLGESLHAELAEMGQRGMTVTTLHPFFTKTPLLDKCSIESKHIPIVGSSIMGKSCVDQIMKETLLQSYPTHLMACFAAKYYLPQRTYVRLRETLGIKFCKK